MKVSDELRTKRLIGRYSVNVFGSTYLRITAEIVREELSKEKWPAICLRPLVIGLCAAGLVGGCASKPPTESRVPPTDYEKAFAAQGDDPKMLEYIRSICAQPQPQRAQLGNELIRTNGIVAGCAYDREQQADTKGARDGMLMFVP